MKKRKMIEEAEGESSDDDGKSSDDADSDDAKSEAASSNLIVRTSKYKKKDTDLIKDLKECHFMI
jgi:hypothetical protein